MKKSRMQIAGWLVVLCTGEKSQTINVCTRAGREGEYAAKVRLRPPFITERHLTGRRFRTIDDMINYLKTEHGATVEQSFSNSPERQRPAGNRGPGLLDRLFGRHDSRQSVYAQANESAAPRSVVKVRPLSPWELQAQQILEMAIDRLVLDFVTQPYLHRVEHSLHCELYRLLTAEGIMAETYPMGTLVSQTVHKEWPEWTPRPEKANRRGNFDLCIIAPEHLGHASRDDFRQGRIEPSFVVELGLDYRIHHLTGDLNKLRNSGLHGSYIVHLVREDVPDNFEQIERIAVESRDVKIAYARVSYGQAFYKLLGDASIRTVPWPVVGALPGDVQAGATTTHATHTPMATSRKLFVNTY